MVIHYSIKTGGIREEASRFMLGTYYSVVLTATQKQIGKHSRYGRTAINSAGISVRVTKYYNGS